MFPDRPYYRHYEDLRARKDAQRKREKDHWASMSTRPTRRGKKR